MNVTRDRMRSFGWAFVLTICAALTFALMMRVNAVKSQVQLAERKVITLKREMLFLETEFATRASQQQLGAINDVEFGLTAPTAGQYLSGERQLASLGKPAAADAPAPIRVAAVQAEDTAPFTAMVSPLTGRAMAAEVSGKAEAKPVDVAGLGKHLSRIPAREVIEE